MSNEGPPAIHLRIQQRERDAHVVIVGGPHDRLWSAGKSTDEAIGDLVRCHPEAFGVTLEYVGEPEVRRG